MGYVVQRYETLKERFYIASNDLMTNHQVTRFADLDQPRKWQVQFLDAIIKKLDKELGKTGVQKTTFMQEKTETVPVTDTVEELRAARILSGFIFTVSNIVDETPSYNPNFGPALKACLALTDNNRLDNASAANLLTSCLNYIDNFLQTSPYRAASLSEDYPWHKIESFDLLKFWQKARDLHTHYYRELLTQALAAEQAKAPEATAAQGGFVSNLTGALSHMLMGGQTSAKSADATTPAMTEGKTC